MNTAEIIDMYVNQNLSTHIIAKKFNTYPNKIRRIIKGSGYELKDRRDAQLAALESGRQTHPTRGKKRDLNTKTKISESVHKNWKEISEEERQKRVEKSQDQWNSMTEAEREELRKAAAQAVRQAAKDGSKMEQYLLHLLRKNGYDVLFHKHGLIVNSHLEIDLFIPALKTAIEIDGPAHFMPIWGEDNLQKHIKSDAQKSGLLLAEGFVVIRIKHLTKSLSEKNKRDILQSVMSELAKIKSEFPEKSNRYIELEVK